MAFISLLFKRLNLVEMTNYLALLRGINVSGQKIIPMATLKILLSEAGMEDVRTYIQSGNILFNYNETNRTSISKNITQLIEQKFGFNVPAIVLTIQELQYYLEGNPFLKETNIDPGHLHFTFLESNPSSELAANIKSLDFSPDRFIISNNIIYVYCPNGYGKTKINNQFFEQRLKMNASTRNLNTVQKLLELTR